MTILPPYIPLMALGKPGKAKDGRSREKNHCTRFSWHELLLSDEYLVEHLSPVIYAKMASNFVVVT